MNTEKRADTRLLRPREVADLAGLHVDTLRRWRAAGTGPPWQRLGPTAVRYPEEGVQAWLKQGEAT